MKTIKNSATAATIAQIPRNTKVRRQFLKVHLKKHQGQVYRSKALGGYPIAVSGISLDETISHASRSRKSTILALNLKSIIEEAQYYRMVLPKWTSKKQVNRFKLSFMFVMEINVGGVGLCSLKIAAKESGTFLLYSITSKREK